MWLFLLLGFLIFVLLQREAFVDATVEENMKSPVDKLADAITHAEGGDIPGAAPYRYNNPGDVSLDLIGKATGTDPVNGYPIYATMADGRENLRVLVAKMLNNTSKIYNRTMTIADVGKRYAPPKWEIWSRNVASYLGVTPETRLDEIV